MAHAEDLVVQERFLAGLKGMVPAVEISTPNEGELLVTETAGQYCVRSRFHRVQFSFDRLNDSRGGVHGEIQVSADWKDDLLGVTDISLKSDSSREKIAKTLVAYEPDLPWKILLEQACGLVLTRYRAGQPTIRLQPSATSQVSYIVNPLVYKGHQSLIYAPGGSCKSYLALYIALLVSHGARQAGIGGVKGPVLYLDWELNEETVSGRLRALQLGHPELSTVTPFYRQCEAPLRLEAHRIAAEVAKHGIQLLILDSCAMACGGELSSPEAAIGLQRALRQIGCASLLLAHVAKNQQEGQQATAFGTVFFRELSRNVWELTNTSDSSPAQLILTQQKNNFGPKHAPLGFSLLFEKELVRVSGTSVEDQPHFADKLPAPAQIRNLLEDGVPRTPKQIAEELGLAVSTVGRTLRRLNGSKWMMLGGVGQKTTWTVLNAKTK
jgi:hypothetical protein